MGCFWIFQLLQFLLGTQYILIMCLNVHLELDFQQQSLCLREWSIGSSAKELLKGLSKFSILLDNRVLRLNPRPQGRSWADHLPSALFFPHHPDLVPGRLEIAWEPKCLDVRNPDIIAFPGLEVTDILLQRDHAENDRLLPQRPSGPHSGFLEMTDQPIVHRLRTL